MKSPFVVALAVVFLSQLLADANDADVVTGAGTVVVKKMPTTVRMSIQFKESGKDLPEALKNLKDRREASIATLKKLEAKKDSIHEGDPAIGGDDPQTARAMAMMGGRPDGGPKKKKAGASKVTVSGKLSAEWPLPDGDFDELLTAVQTLKERIQAADLAGQKAKKKLSPEEMEEAEEMELLQQQQQHFGNRSETKVGEPSYLFLAQISAEDQHKARAAAFRKASATAEALAAAAGRKLGPLKGLQTHNDMTAAYMYNRYNGGEEPEVDDAGDNDNDTVGKIPTCARVPFTFSVQATFELAAAMGRDAGPLP